MSRKFKKSFLYSVSQFGDFCKDVGIFHCRERILYTVEGRGVRVLCRMCGQSVYGTFDFRARKRYAPSCYIYTYAVALKAAFKIYELCASRNRTFFSPSQSRVVSLCRIVVYIRQTRKQTRRVCHCISIGGRGERKNNKIDSRPLFFFPPTSR